MVGKEAFLFPGFSEVYSSLTYLSMSYRTQTLILYLSPVRLYSVPFPSSTPPYPLPITSKFGDISESWLPANSTFKFSANYYLHTSEPVGVFTYGLMSFGEFDQGARKLQGYCRLHFQISTSSSICYLRVLFSFLNRKCSHSHFNEPLLSEG